MRKHNAYHGAVYHCALVLLFVILAIRSDCQITSTYSYNQTQRDVISINDSTFMIIFYDRDGSNTTGTLKLVTYNSSLEALDSLVIDSTYSVKAISNSSGEIFLARSKVYGNSTTSIYLYKLDPHLNISYSGEFKADSVVRCILDLSFINDTLTVFCLRTINTSQPDFIEYYTDTLFQNLDSSNCTLGAFSPGWYYTNTVVLSNMTKIHSGINPFGSGAEYQIYLNQNCSIQSPFSSWSNYIETNTNYVIMGNFTNSLLKKSNSLFVPVAGEYDDINYFGVSAVLKTDFNFNLQSYYVSVAATVGEDQAPFLRRSLIETGNSVLLATNTHTVWNMPSVSPDAINKMRIDVLDTTLNLQSTVLLDPIPNGRPYYAEMITYLQDGSILLSGYFGSLNPPEPNLFFLVKYASLSELLSVSEQYNQELSLKVFPNPSTDIFNFSVPGNETIETVTVFNTTGQEVLSSKPFVSFIDLSNFNAGIYFIEVISGNKVYRARVVKY